MIFSIKSLVSRLSTVSAKESFTAFCTTKYKLHFFETATGLKFVLNTDKNADSMIEELNTIYSRIYVDCIVRNPLHKSGEWLKSELFQSELDAYIEGLPIFK